MGDILSNIRAIITDTLLPSIYDYDNTSFFVGGVAVNQISDIDIKLNLPKSSQVLGFNGESGIDLSPFTNGTIVFSVPEMSKITTELNQLASSSISVFDCFFFDFNRNCKSFIMTGCAFVRKDDANKSTEVPMVRYEISFSYFESPSLALGGVFGG